MSLKRTFSIFLVLAVLFSALSFVLIMQFSPVRGEVLSATTIKGRFLMADNYGNKATVVRYDVNGEEVVKKSEYPKTINQGDVVTGYMLKNGSYILDAGEVAAVWVVGIMSVVACPCMLIGLIDETKREKASRVNIQE